MSISTEFIRRHPQLKRHALTGALVLALSQVVPVLQQIHSDHVAERQSAALEQRLQAQITRLESELDFTRDKLQGEINRKQDRR